MQDEYLITVDEICVNYKADISFIDSLQKNGLIEITYINGSWFLNKEQLPQLERFVRFYYDLDINLEGIETINHLLEKISSMRGEITILKNRLRLYENGRNSGRRS